ncbi:hypothetical protein ILUMI_25934 [Ignelater luminosus]|uniref:Transposase Tc1-like domain-containing protein n=1 Tax=Ignelater luminosus TaxID=2038154 RepID=A0A8K0CAQ2_IGNLU|nr:hypothetical protein ILUMI_25934 [Ignelater luminosus]
MHTIPEKAAQVIVLIENGHSQRICARQLNMTRAAVRNVCDRYEETGSFHHRSESVVQPSVMTVKQELREVRGVNISQWTVRQRLSQSNLTPQIPATDPKRTPAHRQARLNFARDHLNLTLEQWGLVLFSDETKICLYGSDRRKKIYQKSGEQFADCCIEEQRFMLDLGLTKSDIANNEDTAKNNEEAKPSNGLKMSNRIRKRDVDFEANEEEISADAAQKEQPSQSIIEVSKRFFIHRANSKTRSGPKIWDHWGKWTACSVTCGLGKMTRWRHCVSGGCATGEKEAQIKTCTLPAC